MKELFSMWKNTKMVMLTALTGAIFAALLIPFKGIPLIPGFTEIRPAQIIAGTFPLFFGPAGAWGLAIGNLIGDFFGTLGLGSIFGFFGNLLNGFVIYKVWDSFADKPVVESKKDFFKYALAIICGGFTSGLIIAWGLDMLGLLPFAALGTTIPLNNTILPIIIGPPLLKLLYPRIERWGLMWKEILREEDYREPRMPKLGRTLTAIGSVGGIIVGILISTGVYGAVLASFGSGTTGLGVALGLLPFILAMLFGSLYLL
ncbi:MAG: QueT transporter family protein [Halanaerobiales bacterium]